ncbi:hypothetical protein HAX54_007683 [Datura stramonium]|uniref:Uncharacterized protein n=1 Tax=Datura stramonium TaxID=4076 RepID=A0ABS8TD62_DATST|nr:hypothetical protein [Datura stramonium]
MYTSVGGVCRDEGTDSDTSFSVSKSPRSLFMHIGSITIDLNLPIPVKEKVECQHFSIRKNPEKQLPPLDVSKFKRRRCDGCLAEIGADHESPGDGIGDGTRSQGVRIEELGSPATEVIVSKQCSTREIETNSPVAKLLSISTNTKPIPSNDGQRTTLDQIEVLGRKEEVLNMSNMKSRELPSLGSRKGTATSKGSDANLAENSLCDLREDIANHLPRRRKTPKVRLMADLLSGTDYLDKSCANTMPMVPSEPDTVVTPKDKVSLLEDVGRGIKISQKKRNTTQEDGCRSGMNLDGKMDKILKAFNQTKKDERSSIEIEVIDSHPEENGSDREQHLQSGSKTMKVKHKNGKESGVSRNKYKKDQVVGGYFVQIPLEGQNSGLGTNGHGANVLLQSSHNSISTEKVEHHLRKYNESIHGKERDSGLNWNNNKLLEFKHASSHMNVSPDKNLPRESLSNGKDVAQMPIGMGMVMTSQLEKELSFKKKLEQPLSSFRDAQKLVENDTIQSKSITNCPLTLQKDNTLRSNVSELGQSGKGVNSLVRQSNLSETDQYFRKRVNLLVRQPNVDETNQYLGGRMDPLVNMAEAGQYSRKRVNPLVNVDETTQYSREGLNPFVNTAEMVQYSRKKLNPLVTQPNMVETGQYWRKGMDPLARKANVLETNQYLHKGVHSHLRQPNFSELGEPLRKEMIDLNQGIDLNQLQEIESSPNLLHQENLQIQNSMETPCPRRNINLNEVQGHSYVTKLQNDQWPMNVMEKGPSNYVRPMGIVEMLIRNQHERIHPQTQSNWRIGTNENGVLTWLNPGSTSFYPFYADDVGALRGNTPHLSNVKVNSAEIIQDKEKKFGLLDTNTQSQQKPSIEVQVYAPVPTGWGLQHGKGSNLLRFPATQRILFGNDNPQNYVNQENHKLIHGQSPGSLQKGRTISDIKSNTVDLKSWNEWSQTSKKAAGKEHINKGIGSSNLYSSEGMPETLKLQERSFSPCNNHPLIYMDGKQSIFNGSFLPHHLMKEFSGVHMDGFTVVQSSGQPVPYFNDVLPVSSIPKKDPPCLFNQNPADIAEADDERYLRSVEDQRIRDKSSLQEKSGVVNVDGRKRQRTK